MTTPEWLTHEYPFWTAAAIPASTVVYDPQPLRVTLTETYHDGKRWYTAQGQRYPSITTLLSTTDEEGQAALHKWRARVGPAEAERVSRTAATNGTRWHDFCEAYLMGKPVWSYVSDPSAPPMAAAIATLLNTKIRRVLVSESRLMSTRYQVAGRIDVCAELTDGRIAVIDFKTGKKPKSGNRLTNYGLQATFYADALTEWLNHGTVDTIVIVQLCPKMLLWQESSATYWRPALEERVAQFAQLQQTMLS